MNKPVPRPYHPSEDAGRSLAEVPTAQEQARLQAEFAAAVAENVRRRAAGWSEGELYAGKRFDPTYAGGPVCSSCGTFYRLAHQEPTCPHAPKTPAGR